MSMRILLLFLVVGFVLGGLSDLTDSIMGRR